MAQKKILLDLSSLGIPDRKIFIHPDLMISHIIFRIRRHCDLDETQGIFLFVVLNDGTEILPKMTQHLHEFKNIDHIKIMKESMFG